MTLKFNELGFVAILALMTFAASWEQILQKNPRLLSSNIEGINQIQKLKLLYNEGIRKDEEMFAENQVQYWAYFTNLGCTNVQI